MNPNIPNKIKITIIEDNLPFRSALAQILNENEAFEVISQMSECSKMVATFKENQPEIVLMDIELEDGDSGIEGVKTLGHYFPEIKILILTVFEEDDKIFESICAGASGYLLKKSSPLEVMEALLALQSGGAPMSPLVAYKALQLFRNKLNPPTLEFGLSAREKEILRMLSEGITYQNIADKLFISISTIRTHICHIYEKLHVHSKVEAIRKMNSD